jgi:hypothetical protein
MAGISGRNSAGERSLPNVNKRGNAIGIRTPIVPHEDPVTKDINAPVMKIAAGR